MHVGIANLRWPGKRAGIPGACATRNFTYLVRGPRRRPCKRQLQLKYFDLFKVYCFLSAITILYKYTIMQTNYHLGHSEISTWCIFELFYDQSCRDLKTIMEWQNQTLHPNTHILHSWNTLAPKPQTERCWTFCPQCVKTWTNNGQTGRWWHGEGWVLCCKVIQSSLLISVAEPFFTILGPLYKHGLTWSPRWISNYIRYNVWDETTYRFQKSMAQSLKFGNG